MQKSRWTFFLFVLIFLGIICELIIVFLFPKNRLPFISNHYPPTPTLIPIVKNPSVINGVINNIQLGTYSIPPPGTPGIITITGLLKNVYEDNNNIYADIVFQDPTGTTHEDKNVIISPDKLVPFLLRLQSTPDIIPPQNTFSMHPLNPINIIDTLKKYSGLVFVWMFGTVSPDISKIPSPDQQIMQKAIPYFDCNNKFLVNLQKNSFIFPDCEVYASFGSVYVTNAK